MTHHYAVFSDLRVVIPVAAVAAAVLLGLVIALIVGVRKNIWNDRTAIFVLLIIGIVISGTVYTLFFSAAIYAIVS